MSKLAEVRFNLEVKMEVPPFREWKAADVSSYVLIDFINRNVAYHCDEPGEASVYLGSPIA